MYLTRHFTQKLPRIKRQNLSGKLTSLDENTAVPKTKLQKKWEKDLDTLKENASLEHHKESKNASAVLNVVNDKFKNIPIIGRFMPQDSKLIVTKRIKEESPLTFLSSKDKRLSKYSVADTEEIQQMLKPKAFQDQKISTSRIYTRFYLILGSTFLVSCFVLHLLFNEDLYAANGQLSIYDRKKMIDSLWSWKMKPIIEKELAQALGWSDEKRIEMDVFGRNIDVESGIPAPDPKWNEPDFKQKHKIRMVYPTYLSNLKQDNGTKDLPESQTIDFNCNYHLLRTASPKGSLENYPATKTLYFNDQSKPRPLDGNNYFKYLDLSDFRVTNPPIVNPIYLLLNFYNYLITTIRTIILNDTTQEDFRKNIRVESTKWMTIDEALFDHIKPIISKLIEGDGEDPNNPGQGIKGHYEINEHGVRTFVKLDPEFIVKQMDTIKLHLTECLFQNSQKEWFNLFLKKYWTDKTFMGLNESDLPCTGFVFSSAAMLFLIYQFRLARFELKRAYHGKYGIKYRRLDFSKQERITDWMVLKKMYSVDMKSVVESGAASSKVIGNEVRDFSKITEVKTKGRVQRRRR